MFNHRLCLITDFNLISGDNLESIIKKAIAGGVDMIQYRDKDADSHTRLKRGRAIRKITKEEGALFILNGQIDAAIELNADGIQTNTFNIPVEKLRKKIGREKLIGVSVHNESEISLAGSADFLMLSPLFTPLSKKICGSPLGEERFAELCRRAQLPVIALGGITEKNIAAAIRSGAYGAACIGGLLGSPDIYNTAKMMKMTILNESKRSAFSSQRSDRKKAESSQLNRDNHITK